jgi:hypothetical protein
MLAVAALMVVTCAHQAIAQLSSQAVALPSAASGEPVRAASSPLAGVFAVGSIGNDGVNATGSIELRGPLGGVLQTWTASELVSVAGLRPQGVQLTSMTMSTSGRLIYAILAGELAGSGQLRAVVLRLEMGRARGSVFWSLPSNITSPRALAHVAGRLYVGETGLLTVFNAGRNDTAGSTRPAIVLTGGDVVRALAVDHARGEVLAVDRTGRIYRITASSAAVAGNVQLAGLGSDVAGAVFHDHLGARSGAGSARGLIVLLADGRLIRVAPEVVLGQQASSWTQLGTLGSAVSPGTTAGLSVGGDGRMLAVAGASSLRMLSSTTDDRLSLQAWMEDEVQQVTNISRGLISPDGEPSGWVIDADTTPSIGRFHPASPDAASWTVLMLLVNDELTGRSNPQNLVDVRRILKRYAGRAGGPVPLRNQDGIYNHWIDPVSGNQKAGWGDTYSTMSTMKMVLAASRAVQHWPEDDDLRASAAAIACNVRDWDTYLVPSTGQYFLSGSLSGPLSGSLSSAFNEGALFIEQASWYGGVSSQETWANWLDRFRWPLAAFVGGRLVTGDVGGQFLPAFATLYSALVQPEIRASLQFQDHYENLRVSSSAWTDDNPARWYTVFSAGTTKTIWNAGGYNADKLPASAGNISTFPSLMAMVGRSFAAPSTQVGVVQSEEWRLVEAVAAYHAYRTGARQVFRTGANLLYRRSSIDQVWEPNSAGLPDVVLGGLGLAEAISPGIVNRVLNGSFVICGCPADMGRAGGAKGRDGLLDNNDFVVFIDGFFRQDGVLSDVGREGGANGGDGIFDNNDFIVFVNAFFAGCP